MKPITLSTQTVTIPLTTDAGKFFLEVCFNG